MWASSTDFGLTFTVDGVMIFDGLYGWGQEVYACGWPLQSFEGWQLQSWHPSEPGAARGTTGSGWEQHLINIDGDPRLPTKPIFPAFLLNTLFYAAPWWLILATPTAIRRNHRRTRGRCIHCGYDLAGLREGNDTLTCPECGHTARPTPKHSLH